MSARDLARSPWVRLLVVVLALVQVIAPTWHVCELGGGSNHCAMPMSGRTGMAHGFQLAAGNDARRPVICACAERQPAPSQGPLLQARAQNGCDTHCLALLLQSMPGQWAASHDLFGFAAIHRRPAAVREILYTGRQVRENRGRAPPLSI